MAPFIRIGVLISGGGSNLQAILEACAKTTISGKVVFVGTDNPSAKGLRWAAKYDIPTFAVDYNAIISGYHPATAALQLPEDFDLEDVLSKQRIFKHGEHIQHLEAFFLTRAIAETGLLEQIQAHPFDLLVLAGFMRTLSPYFIDHIVPNPAEPRIMNIHPALLPSFPGIDGYGDTFRYGCKVGGCTVHFVDYGEDTGPIIGQTAFQIQPNDTLESVKKKGLELEWRLYPQCIQLFAEGRLKAIEQEFHQANGKRYRRKVVKIQEA
ncbi:MAG: phosphoribosylglycinamide formyltransferase [Desulfobacterales bacterium]|nr:phosphoribosylglycinamide formyltransferase [Desulfobacterales bacterium]